MNGRLIVLHGRDHVVGLAVFGQAARGLVLGMHGVDGDDAAAEVELSRQLPHRRNLIGLGADLDLSQNQAAAVFHGGHHHAPFLADLLRGAAHVLAVHGHGHLAAMPGTPRPQRLIQGVGRHCREHVMEGRCRRYGITPMGRTPEAAHRLALRVVQAGGKLAERAHAAIAGQPRRDRDRQIAGDAVAPPARLAEIGNLLQKVVQTAQLRRRHRFLLRADAPLDRFLDATQRRARIGFQRIHVDLLRLSVLAPPRRAARQAREAARASQHPPVRCSVAGAREARRIDERLGQQNRETVRRAHVPRQPPQTQTQYPRRQVARHALAAQNHKAAIVGDQLQPPELPFPRPADPGVPGGNLERSRRPAHKRNPGLSCTATWRRDWPNRPLNGR